MLAHAKSLLISATNKALKSTKGISGAAAGMAAKATKTAKPGVSILPALKLIGFGKKGIVKESLAAGLYREVGVNVAKGPFAILQSCGAGGYGAAIINSRIKGTVKFDGKQGKKKTKQTKNSSKDTK
ncbi:hypothetical protein FHETE_4896 [Fusarium heterosporum]|uniref:Uncharacterized protein n=1 Tax=Fusarium heterosporum TaxID=42747 RepID=A0A8H5TEG3_FUSHE|nr:hypothetical protein FHETE_4896 [Fusarium heterosporum]